MIKQEYSFADERIVVNPAQEALYVDGIKSRLAGIPLYIMEHLGRHIDSFQPKTAIEAGVWGEEIGDRSTNLVPMYISNIRKKIGPELADPT